MDGFAARASEGCRRFMSAVVGAEGFVDRRRQDSSLGYGGGCGGQSFVMRASSCPDDELWPPARLFGLLRRS